jgi:chorismate dehydratase
MTYTVGSVPYVNAIPLTIALEDSDSPVKVIYEVPSKLPQLLESGQAQAILVSSVDALRHPDRKMAAGVCIGSNGPVESVRLFSKVPFRGIETLALDASSMTSNRLAQVLLSEVYHVQPRTTTHAPDLGAMLKIADACVLIGDIGMTTASHDLIVLDLGEAWTQLTGKPFVWAAWIGDAGLTSELSGILADAAARARSRELLRKCITKAADRPGWGFEMAERYFTQTMLYRMGYSEIEGLREFAHLLQRNGFHDCRYFPEIVSAVGFE